MRTLRPLLGNVPIANEIGLLQAWYANRVATRSFQAILNSKSRCKNIAEDAQLPLDPVGYYLSDLVILTASGETNGPNVDVNFRNFLN
jgi:hypothetical protein